MFEIPMHRLPPGYLDRLGDEPAQASAARPAATAVLLRDGERGLEVLMLRRHAASGFVPGAFVFPGGRVDAADADPALPMRTDGLPPAGSGPVAAYWFAAIREVFEETGVLLARGAGHGPTCASLDPSLAAWREELMEERGTLAGLAETLGLRLAADRMVPCAHWITPVAEPRRYDTRFFLAHMPEGCVAVADAREMTEAIWLAPVDALARFQEGRMPMVFPTVATLESLVAHRTAEGALDAFRSRAIVPILPRLVRTAVGVSIVIDDASTG